MALDQPTSMLCLVPNMTNFESRTHQNWKLQTSETKIVRRRIQIHQYATWRTHLGPKATWWHVFSRSSTGICTTVHINAGRFASARFHVGRTNKQICDHGGWTTHSNAVLKSTTQCYLSAHQELKIQSIHIKNSWPKHVHELHNETL